MTLSLPHANSLVELRERYNALLTTPETDVFEVAEAANRFAWELRMSDAKTALFIATDTLLKISSLPTPEIYFSPIDFESHRLYCASFANLITGECHWRLSDYFNSISHLHQALLIFEQLGSILDSQLHLAQTLNGIAIVLERFGDYEKALQHHQRSLQIRKSLLDRQGEGSSLMGIGIVHQYRGDYAEALSFLHRSLKIRSEIGDRFGEASSYNQLGAVYSKVNDIAKAIDCFHKSLFIRQSLQDTLGEATVLANLGDAYLKLSETEQALQCYQKSLAIKHSSGDQRAEATALIGIGKVYLSINDELNAVHYFSQAHAISNVINEPRLQAETLYEISRTLLALPEEKVTSPQEINERILDCLFKALSIAEQLGAKNLIYPIYLQLAKFHERIHDDTLALHYYKNYHDAREEVFSLEMEEKVRRIRILNEIERKEREAEFERREAEIYRRRNLDLEQTLAEAERQRQLAQEANTVKTELLAIAAHDMKNPLQSILGFSEFLLEDAEEGTPLHEYLTIIRQSAHGMFQLISDLLKTASLENGRIKLKKTSFNLHNTIFYVIESQKPTALRKAQSIFFDAPETLYYTGDEERLREAFDNLLSNAIKYSPFEKPILVRLLSHNEWIEISVQDEGQGLLEEDMPKLFGQFQRLSARPTGNEPSTGLGLSLVKQIIELHGGSVYATSEGKNKGTIFTIRLPLGTSSRT